MIKYTIFRNIMIFLVLFLLTSSILFSISHHVSVEVLRNTLEKSAENQLEFSMHQLEESLRQLEMQSLVLINDSSVKAYANAEDFSEYISYLFERKYMEEKLDIQRNVNTVTNEISIYYPKTQETISTESGKNYDNKFVTNSPKNKWFATTKDDQMKFHYLVTNPHTVDQYDLKNVTTIVESTVTNDFLTSKLSSLDASGNGVSFFHFSDNNILSNHNINQELINLLNDEDALKEDTSTTPRLSVVMLEDVEYLVQTIYSPSLGGTLGSYIKLDTFLSPLNNVKLLLIGSLVFLVITGIVLSLTLFRHFRINLGHLIKKIELLGTGDYKSRVTIKANNEFDFLFARFNNMAAKIQSLIENVYEEKVRTREAEFKHLQSQINPHFLYNCLFYIVTMAHKSPDAVVSMADNLAKYYRYITRQPGGNTTLNDEISLIENYLHVQSLRNKRLRYTIDIPLSIRNISVPTLLLQPIIENAILHGLDRKVTSGYIQIKGKIINDYHCAIIIEDDGIGMSSDEIALLSGKLNERKNSEKLSCGLWNIHQRLINQFGTNSGLQITRSELGGLCVTFYLFNDIEEDTA